MSVAVAVVVVVVVVLGLVVAVVVIAVVALVVAVVTLVALVVALVVAVVVEKNPIHISESWILKKNTLLCTKTLWINNFINQYITSNICFELLKILHVEKPNLYL